VDDANEDDLVTAAEALGILGVPINTTLRWAREGLLRSVGRRRIRGVHPSIYRLGDIADQRADNPGRVIHLDEVVEMIGRGMTVGQIAGFLDVQPASITRAAQRRGTDGQRMAIRKAGMR
jgi:hypothetical protein